MRRYCPLTKEIAFARLDKRLSDEEKKEIIEADSMTEFHFSLGMWIRNTWLYNNEPERINSLLKSLGEEDPVCEIDGYIFLPMLDSISNDILEAYQEHLKKNYAR